MQGLQCTCRACSLPQMSLIYDARYALVTKAHHKKQATSRIVHTSWHAEAPCRALTSTRGVTGAADACVHARPFVICVVPDDDITGRLVGVTCRSSAGPSPLRSCQVNTSAHTSHPRVRRMRTGKPMCSHRLRQVHERVDEEQVISIALARARRSGTSPASRPGQRTGTSA